MTRPLVIVVPPAWWRLGITDGFIHTGQVFILPDGLTVRVDDFGHVDAIHQGGAAKPGVAWDPAPGRRP